MDYTARSYKITIEEVIIVKTKGREHKVVERRPMTDQELEETDGRSYSYLKKEEKAGQIPYKDVYDYVESEKVTDQSRKIYEQIVPSLDIAKVIHAIIDLPPQTVQFNPAQEELKE